MDNVYNIIKELSSEKYKGRRFGTEENMEAVKYVENEFKKIGLKPAGDKGTYLINYSEISKIFNGVPVLELIDGKGNVVKSYKHGVDFVESGRGYDIPGEVVSGFKFINYYTNYKLENTTENNLIAVSHITANSRQSFYMMLKQSGYKALLAVTNNKYDLRVISAGLGNRTLANTGYEIPVITIKQRVSDEIKEYKNKNYKLRVRTVIDAAYKPVADVIGVIPGKTKDSLLITAHLDHVGQSPDGITYPGALDNASGTAAMLEIARYIKSQGKKPTKNIVFIAFNAEEGGCLGSERYVRDPKYPLDRTTVINLDMIGANKDIPLTIMFYNFFDYINGEKKDSSSKLRNEITNLSKDMGIQTEIENAMSSDHIYFNFKGVPAITLIDYDSSKVHTPEDDINNINKTNIDRALKLSMNYINLIAFSTGLLRGSSILNIQICTE